MRAQLPWRAADGLTECGLASEKFTTLDYQHFIQKVEEQGRQRAAMSTCMTCWDAAERHQRSWRGGGFNTPTLLSILHREVERVRWSEDRDGGELRIELMAIAALIEAHREEFEHNIASLKGVVFLTDVRKAKGKR